MLLFTDIDNTVIYSHRHLLEDTKIWIEEIDGHPQSFVTKNVYEFYSNQKYFTVVPITTRTKEQYDRLKKGLETFGWQDALVCNGAILLRNGVEDEEWTKYSLHISNEDRNAFNEAYTLALKLVGEQKIVYVDSFMFYLKVENTLEIFSTLYDRVDKYHVEILQDSHKIYCIPKSLNKGRAAERYKEYFGYNAYIAAGDSVFDIPMLEKASICLCPNTLKDFPAEGKKIICNDLFSDDICFELEKIERKSNC